MNRALERRRRKGTLRHLPASHVEAPQTSADATTTSTSMATVWPPIDYSSNDYLGLAHSLQQRKRVEERLQQLVKMSRTNDGDEIILLGATGSRLLSGDSSAFHHLEQYLARVHHREAALLFNSGYDANLSVVSSLPCDCILYDELIHNSLHMGMRLWVSSSKRNEQVSSGNGDDFNEQSGARSSAIAKYMSSFAHNDVRDLKNQLEQLTAVSSSLSSARRNKIVVLVESVYSMDGDIAVIREILEVCQEFQALLVVDEAHGLGVFGRPPQQLTSSATMGLPGTGVLARDELEQHPALFCSIHTFGKAAGCHGAVVCGTKVLKDYLTNYAYPLIYSTALPFHSLVAIQCAYETMTSRDGDVLRSKVLALVESFQERLSLKLQERQQHHSGSSSSVRLLPSHSPIQALLIPGNQTCTDFCQYLYTLSNFRIRLYPIKSPTVPIGQERVRIVLHAHNTNEDLDILIRFILQTLEKMNLIQLQQMSRL